MTAVPLFSPITIAILAGGESQRMGQDKAGLMWQGQTLLARMVQAAQQVVPQVAVAGRARPDTWTLPNVLFLPDAQPGEGPLRGLEAALNAAPNGRVLALACDMPLLSPDALRWLLAQAAAAAPDADGLAVRHNDQWEPLFSVYAARCLPRIQERLAHGQRSLHRLLESGQFVAVDAPPWVGAQLVNINTPTDLAALTA